MQSRDCRENDERREGGQFCLERDGILQGRGGKGDNIRLPGKRTLDSTNCLVMSIPQEGVT